MLQLLTTAGSQVLSRRASAALRLPTHALTLTETPRRHGLQTRLFHHTPARRSELANILASALGFAVAWRFLSKIKDPLRAHARPPPLSWLRDADPGTITSISVAVNAAFKLAESRPASQRAEALREAAFAVPYEIAALNQAAPDFRLEEVGSCQELSGDRFKSLVSTVGPHPPLDVHEDTKIFLYFPSKEAEKATAVFMAVNTGLHVAELAAKSQTGALTHGTLSTGADPGTSLIRYAAILWANQYTLWAAETPNKTTDRLAPGPVPVIFSFREKTCGDLYHPDVGQFDGTHAAVVIGLVEPEPA